MRLVPLLLVAGMVAGMLAACGLGDTEVADCRCAEDTDVVAFPQCLNAELVGREEAENPLATRIPDCPSGRRLFLREPTRPVAVLFNIRDTVMGFSPIQYMDQLDETFLFVPDVDALELYQEVFNPPSGYDPGPPDVDTLWTRGQERQFIVNLLDKEKFQSIEFDRWYDSDTDERDVSVQLEETYRFPYKVVFTEKPREGAVEVEQILISGRMYVTVTTPTEENPVWIVTRWQDFRDLASARRSWTELRGEFSP